jgi:acyl-CoA reductase-like NAD-dependent aldehyde dehydrogenase
VSLREHGKIGPVLTATLPTSRQRRLFLGGEWVETGEWTEVRSPYSGDVVGRVAKAGASHARAAIDAAEAAMRNPIPAHERAAILDRISAALVERREEAARTICDEAGKPIKAARVEAARASSTYTMAAVEARTLAGDVVPMDASEAGVGKLAFTLRLPVGIVGAISPFNFPLNLVAHKLAPSLAAGCAVVLKPATATPLSAFLLAELAEAAGLPAGWLSVLVGPSAEIGDVLVGDERVKAISFTGSGPVGWGLRERAPKKRVALELGNATPVIVAADADLETAAAKVAAHAFSFAGQSCISVQRVYIERPAYDEFVARLLPKVEALQVGDPADDATDVGPVIDDDNRDRILDWIARSGGEVLTGGKPTEDGVIRPTVIERPRPDAEVSCDEVFGPVCTVQPYDELGEAIAAANSTRYGLQAGIFTKDVAAALRAAHGLEFGGVTVNEAPTFRADQMPYGGVKDSGNTREGPHYAVRELLTEERLVVLDVG